MRIDRRVAGVAAVVVLAATAAGAGIAQAVGGGAGESVTGAEGERAARAALAAAGGGTVLEVERQDGDGAGIYEVEVRRTDGTEVEIHLDGQFRAVGSASDDDGPSDRDDEDGTSDSDD